MWDRTSIAEVKERFDLSPPTDFLETLPEGLPQCLRTGDPSDLELDLISAAEGWPDFTKQGFIAFAHGQHTLIAVGARGDLCGLISLNSPCWEDNLMVATLYELSQRVDSIEIDPDELDDSEMWPDPSLDDLLAMGTIRSQLRNGKRLMNHFDWLAPLTEARMMAACDHAIDEHGPYGGATLIDGCSPGRAIALLRSSDDFAVLTGCALRLGRLREKAALPALCELEAADPPPSRNTQYLSYVREAILWIEDAE